MLVYGKTCPLSVELEHKAYLAVKFLNFYEKTARQKRFLKLDELEEIKLRSYENHVIYSERTKIYHDKKLVRREFQIGQHVLLYNFQLKLFPNKLKSRWFGPFIVNKVLVKGPEEIKNPGDLYIFTVHG